VEAGLTGRYDLRLTTVLLRSRNLNQVKEFRWLLNDVARGGIQVRKRSVAQINNALHGINMVVSHGGFLPIFSVPGDEFMCVPEYS
jgi:hypothetical protein